MRAGLLGRKLGHSFSPQIHRMLATYSYDLFEVEPDQLESFIRSDRFNALNVTIPYKKAVIPYLSEISADARAIGSVNTIVKRPDGGLFGDNTDAAGFRGMIECLDIDPGGKKALVLGSGGASVTCVHVLKSMGARDVIVISRSGEDNYDNIEKHADAEILVNATPVGMYPNNGASPVDIARLPQLKAVLDLIYNPARTRLIQSALDRGIPALGGLYMLVEQARCASEIFTGNAIPREKTDEIHAKLRCDTENIVLVGMPGCGKSSIGRIIAEKTGRELIDADARIVEKIGCSIPEFFKTHSEKEFRAVESEVLGKICKLSGKVIATGGGCVTVPENKPLLTQNGMVFYIRR
ncbi:MAG: shikimate kinase, partial [Clostridia bacterium]|nr:shikimate kinase [Clostridia bacterium]